MVSGYPTFTSIPRVDGLSTDPRVLGCHNGNQTHPSKCMILLEYLHEIDENVTHPFPLLKPSLTPSCMPKSSVRKYCFQTKGFFVLENIIPSFGKIYWTTLRGELSGNSPKQFMGLSDVSCWTTLQGNSSKNLPLKFLS